VPSTLAQLLPGGRMATVTVESASLLPEIVTVVSG